MPTQGRKKSAEESPGNFFLDLKEPRGYISRVITERKVFECWEAGFNLHWKYLLPKIKDMLHILHMEERNQQAGAGPGIGIPIPPWVIGGIALKNIRELIDVLEVMKGNIEDQLAEISFKKCIRANLLAQESGQRWGRWISSRLPGSVRL